MQLESKEQSLKRLLNRNELNGCTNYELFNALQKPLSKLNLFIDIRDKSEFQKFHIIHALHLPSNAIGINEIVKLFSENFFWSNIFIYSSNQQIKQNKDIEFYNLFIHTLEFTLNEKDHTIYILNDGFEHFHDQFPFLCVANDKMYYGAIKNMMDIYYKRQDKYQEYPNQIIYDSLYLGTIEQAMSKSVLQNLKITHIINVTTTEYDDMSIIGNRKYKMFNIADQSDATIMDFFQESFDFIDNALNGNDDNKNNKNNNNMNRVFVHCKEGRSRSASIVIAYIMKSRKVKFEYALQFVKNRRNLVDPNKGFVKQLIQFEKNNYTVKSKKN